MIKITPALLSLVLLASSAAACLPTYDPDETPIRNNNGDDDDDNNDVPDDCDGAVAELCDGVDNDCDGVVDEDFPTRGLPCGNNTGACIAVTLCEDGQEVCSAVQAPEDEACDGLDNDCDGLVDELTEDDPNNCGGCGIVCDTPNGTAGCQSGQCVVEACQNGFEDCDRDPDNGCETNTTNDPTNCGGCGTICTAEFAETTCTAGQCVIEQCQAGRTDCNNFALDGCEADLTLDPLNCGGCGTTCDTPNAQSQCVDSGCQFVECLNGFGDIDANPLNGCEVGLSLLDSPPDPNLGLLSPSGNVLLGAASDRLIGYALGDGGSIGEQLFERTLGSSVIQVDADGNTVYASLAQGDVQILDIADPNNITTVGLVTTSGPSPGFVRSGNLMYLADGLDGLRVVDITNPSEPLQRTRVPTPSSVKRVHLAGDRLILNDPARAELTLMDVSQPDNPTNLGTFGTQEVFDQAILSGDLLATGRRNTDRLRLYRVEPERLTFLGTLTLPGGLVGMELRFPFVVAVVRGPDSRVNIVLGDIRRPQAPNVANTYAAPVQNVATSAAIDGEQIYISGSGGLQRFNISDLRQPQSLQDIVRPQDLRDTSFKDGRLFVSFAGSVEINDYTDPNNPVRLARVGQDLRVVHANGTNLYATSDAQGTVAYRLVDINDDTEPFAVVPGPRPTALESDASGNVLYTLRNTSLEVINILGNIEARGQLTLPTSCQHMVRHANLLYLACTNGVIVVEPNVNGPTIVAQPGGESQLRLELFGQTLYGVANNGVYVYTALAPGELTPIGLIDVGATGLRTLAGAGGHMIVGNTNTLILLNRAALNLTNPQVIAPRVLEGNIVNLTSSAGTFFAGTNQGVFRLAVEGAQ